MKTTGLFALCDCGFPETWIGVCHVCGLESTIEERIERLRDGRPAVRDLMAEAVARVEKLFAEGAQEVILTVGGREVSRIQATPPWVADCQPSPDREAEKC